MPKTDLFPWVFLRDALKAAGLPYTKPTVLRYERLGIIRPGANSIVRKFRIDRIYTREEVGEIIRTLKEWIQAHGDNRSKKGN